MKILDVISTRSSPRAIDPDRELTTEQIETVFEAARWAPSSSNKQPWRFVVFTKDNNLELARNWLAEGNAWATRAPALILVVAKVQQDSTPNRFAQHDTGAATVLAALQAHAMGLLFHQMEGYDNEKAKKDLKLPADFEAMSLIALGYPGREDLLSEKDAKREHAPRVRNQINEILTYSSWFA